MRSKLKRVRLLNIESMLLVVLAFSSVSCSVLKQYLPLCNQKIRGEAEIRKLAGERLERFCATHGLDKDAFTEPPRLSLMEKEKIWVVDYQSREDFVRFIVDNCGAVETSFGPREKIIKIK